MECEAGFPVLKSLCLSVLMKTCVRDLSILGLTQFIRKISFIPTEITGLIVCCNQIALL